MFSGNTYLLPEDPDGEQCSSGYRITTLMNAFCAIKGESIFIHELEADVCAGTLGTFEPLFVS
jgi:hypothetical protein